MTSVEVTQINVVRNNSIQPQNYQQQCGKEADIHSLCSGCLTRHEPTHSSYQEAVPLPLAVLLPEQSKMKTQSHTTNNVQCQQKGVHLLQDDHRKSSKRDNQQSTISYCYLTNYHNKYITLKFQESEIYLEPWGNLHSPIKITEPGRKTEYYPIILCERN